MIAVLIYNIVLAAMLIAVPSYYVLERGSSVWFLVAGVITFTLLARDYSTRTTVRRVVERPKSDG